MTDDSGRENQVDTGAEDIPDDLLAENISDPLSAGEERQLPRKVELDIEELPQELSLEEEDVQEIIEEQSDDELDEEEPQKRSYLKLAIISGGAVLLIAIIAIGVIFSLSYFNKLKLAQSTKQALFTRENLIIELKPFIINFRADESDQLLKAVFVLTFSKKEATDQFNNQKVVMRDLIFRYLLGRGPAEIDREKIKFKIKTDLMKIIQSQISDGQLEKLEIKELILV